MTNSNVIKEFDLEYRPDTYWSQKSKVSLIKGEKRRQLVKDLIGSSANVPESLLEENASQEILDGMKILDRQALGGEFVPNLGINQTEIVRIWIDSTFGDIVSVRAAMLDAGISYSMHDDHEEKYIINPESSKLPITMQEIINLIETAHVIDTEWLLMEKLRAGGLGFFNVTSNCYPQLEAWYNENEQKLADESN